MASRLRLVAGLGNPGPEYADTRHNIGFRVLETLAADWGVPLRSVLPDLRWGRGRIAEIETVLAEPTGYMNRSGPPLRAALEQLDINVADVVIVHDDLDLDFARLKIKAKGGHGGHKGVQSVMDAFGRDDFSRVRMGIGHPPPGRSVIDHVLGRFTPEEARHLDPFVARGRDAVKAILCKGAKESMSAFNRKFEMEVKTQNGIRSE